MDGAILEAEKSTGRWGSVEKRRDKRKCLGYHNESIDPTSLNPIKGPNYHQHRMKQWRVESLHAPQPP